MALNSIEAISSTLEEDLLAGTLSVVLSCRPEYPLVHRGGPPGFAAISVTKPRHNGWMTEKSAAGPSLVESSDGDFDPNTILQVFAERLRERDKPVDLSISQATLNANSSVKRPMSASTPRHGEQGVGNASLNQGRARFGAAAARWDMSDVSDVEDISERRPALGAPLLAQPAAVAQDWVIEEAAVAVEQGQERQPRQEMPLSAVEETPHQAFDQDEQALDSQTAEPVLQSEPALDAEALAAQEVEARRAAHQRLQAEREQAAQQAKAERARAKAVKLEEERKAKQAAQAQARAATQAKLAEQAELAKRKKQQEAKAAAEQLERQALLARREAERAAEEEKQRLLAAERELAERERAARETAEREAAERLAAEQAAEREAVERQAEEREAALRAAAALAAAQKAAAEEQEKKAAAAAEQRAAELAAEEAAAIAAMRAAELAAAEREAAAALAAAKAEQQRQEAAALAVQAADAAERARLVEAAEAEKAAALALREAQALAQRQAHAAERARLQAEAAAPFLRIDMPKLAPKAAQKTDAPDLDLSSLGLSRLGRQSSPAAAPELDLSGLAARAQPQAKPAPDLQDFRALLTQVSQVSQQAAVSIQPLHAQEAPTSGGPAADWQASEALREALQAQRQQLEAQSPLDLASLSAISALARKGGGGSRAS